MTPDQMVRKAISALTEEFSRVHEEPEVDAQAFLAKLRASGWKPLPLDPPASGRRSTREGRAAARRLFDDIRQQKSAGGAA